MMREVPAIDDQGWGWMDREEALAEYFSEFLRQGENEALRSVENHE